MKPGETKTYLNTKTGKKIKITRPKLAKRTRMA